MSNRVIPMGNNEQVTVGIERLHDGRYLALTFTASRTFKTRKGAEAWLEKRGVGPKGWPSIRIDA